MRTIFALRGKQTGNAEAVATIKTKAQGRAENLGALLADARAQRWRSATTWGVGPPQANRKGRHGDERCGVAIGLRSDDLTRLALQPSDGRSLFSLGFIVNTSLAIVRLPFEKCHHSNE